MAGADPLCQFTQHSLGGHLGVHGVLPRHSHATIWGYLAYPWLKDLSVVTCKYELVDINVTVIRHAFEFWEARKSSIDFPICSRDDQEWFSAKYRVW